MVLMDLFSALISNNFQLTVLVNKICLQLPRARHVFLRTHALSVILGTATSYSLVLFDVIFIIIHDFQMQRKVAWKSQHNEQHVSY